MHEWNEQTSTDYRGHPDYDYHHVTSQHVRQIQNSVALDTRAELYSLPKPKFSRLQKWMMTICVGAGCLYLLWRTGWLEWIPVLWK